MARHTEADVEYEAEDLIGQRLFNENKHMGLGVVVDVVTRRGERRLVTRPAPGESTTTRDVDDVIHQLESDAFSLDTYDVGDVFDDADAEDFGL